MRTQMTGPMRNKKQDQMNEQKLWLKSHAGMKYSAIKRKKEIEQLG